MNIYQFNWWCDDYKQTPDNWFINFFKYCSDQFEDTDDYQINIYTVFAFHPNSNPCINNKTINFFFIGENTSIYYSNGHMYDKMDTILTFFHDTPKSLRFPLWLIYWDFYSDGLFQIPEKTMTDKRHACIIVSHDKNGYRNMVCNNIIPFMEIDSNFSGVRHTRVVNVPYGISEKREFMKKYDYNICLENSIRDGYVTEKIFESLYSGCIPIYAGPLDIEPKILNSQDIVNVLENNVDLNKHISNDTWKENALIYIFACYLKVWSIVFLKFKFGILKSNIYVKKYQCNSKEECVDILKNHWLKYKKFMYPRAHFIVGEKEYYMEDIAEDMYNKYNL